MSTAINVTPERVCEFPTCDVVNPPSDRAGLVKCFYDGSPCSTAEGRARRTENGSPGADR